MSEYKSINAIISIIASALHAYENPVDTNKMTASQINDIPTAVILRYNTDPKFNATVKSASYHIHSLHDAALASLKAENERLKEEEIKPLEISNDVLRRENDALRSTLAALREENERLKAEERRRVAGLRETRDALVEKLRSRLSAAEGKVEKARKCVDILDSHYPDTPAYRELKQILGGK